MGTYKPPVAYIGTVEIMEMFDTFSEEYPVWSLWYSDREKAFDWNRTDFEKGRKLFEQLMQVQEDSGNTRVLYVRFYPEPVKGIISKNSPYACCVHVQACKGDDVEAIGGLQNYNNSGIGAALRSINERLVAIEGTEVAEAAEITGVEKVIGYVNTLMENPATSQVIQGLIGKVMELFNPVKPVATAAINGTAESATGNAPVSENQPMANAEVDGEKLNAALTRLQYHCELDNDLTRLADMAESNPATFKMMLGMLRTQTV